MDNNEYIYETLARVSELLQDVEDEIDGHQYRYLIGKLITAATLQASATHSIMEEIEKLREEAYSKGWHRGYKIGSNRDE